MAHGWRSRLAACRVDGLNALALLEVLSSLEGLGDLDGILQISHRHVCAAEQLHERTSELRGRLSRLLHHHRGAGVVHVDPSVSKLGGCNY